MIQEFLSDNIAVRWRKNVDGFLERVKDFVSSRLKKHVLWKMFIRKQFSDAY